MLIAPGRRRAGRRFRLVRPVEALRVDRLRDDAGREELVVARDLVDVLVRRPRGGALVVVRVAMSTGYPGDTRAPCVTPVTAWRGPLAGRSRYDETTTGMIIGRRLSRPPTQRPMTRRIVCWS